ncbi:MFS transporter [Roseixanthobacter glucoisosaccharinicivorans]|uniref:MFS transporter n=1 Tax=Roseixanthobacter glucoisosaccharinicivorans TaxID=3119923 RepID=UPI00372B49B3
MIAVPGASGGPGARRSTRALSAVNFFLADVRDGLGPFLGIFLVGQGWAPDTIGYVMTVGGLAGMLATTPLGALADATRHKRALIAACALAVMVASLALLAVPSFWLTASSQVATGIAAAAIGPAIASLTLGLVGQAGYARQLGHNEAFNHGGNLAAAALAGGFGYVFGVTAVFVIMAVMAVGSLAALAFIRPEDVDYQSARGLESGTGAPGPAPIRVLLTCLPLQVVAATLLLFHFGNAAMLPLLGQAIAAKGGADPSAYTAATVVIAQLTMIPMALLAARLAGTRGYWLVLLLALLALPVRGLIAGLWQSPYALVPVQILDGVGAGLLGVATPGLAAQILRGTGHANIGLGVVLTCQGLGAALSPALAGFLAARFGYGVAFLALAGVAIAALGLWVIASGSIRAAIGAMPGHTQRSAQAEVASEA